MRFFCNNLNQLNTEKLINAPFTRLLKRLSLKINHILNNFKFKTSSFKTSRLPANKTNNLNYLFLNKVIHCNETLR